VSRFFLNTSDALVRARLEVELETARLENQVARLLRNELAWRCFKRIAFWAFVLWLLASIFGGGA
jgi:hypothetical protein